MKGHTHLFAGITAGCVAGVSIIAGTQSNNITEACLVAGFSVLGSLTPDIDIYTSKVGQKAKVLSKIITVLFGHRGIVHSPFFCLLLDGIVLLTLKRVPFIKPVCLGFTLGYLIHLLQDTFTKHGIAWCMPFSKHRISFRKKRSGEYEGGDFFISLLLSTIPVMILFKIV